MQCDGKAVRGLLWSFFTSLITRCALVTLCDSSTSPGLCLARCSKPNHRIRTSTPALSLKRCLFSSQPHMQSKYYSSNMFLVVLVSSGALNFKWKHDKAVGVLTFSPGCGCSRPYYSNSRTGCAKKKKKKKRGVQFQDSLSNFNVNTLELQLKVSALTLQLQFQFKLERWAWNKRKCLHLLIQSDCADGVFMEIHQVCDKNLYLSGQLFHAHWCDEAATQTGSLNGGLKLAPFWHQGCFDLFVCSN